MYTCNRLDLQEPVDNSGKSALEKSAQDRAGLAVVGSAWRFQRLTRNCCFRKKPRDICKFMHCISISFGVSHRHRIIIGGESHVIRPVAVAVLPQPKAKMRRRTRGKLRYIQCLHVKK